MHRLRHGGERTLARSAEWALQQLSEFTSLREGYVFVREEDDVVCLAQIGDAAHRAALGPWVAERLRALGHELSTVVTSTTDSATDPNRFEVEGDAFRFTPLLAPRDGGEPATEVVGALVLSGDASVPFPVLRTIAERLRGVTASCRPRG